MNQAMTVGIPYTLETDEKLVNETFGPNNIRRRRTGTHELKQMTSRMAGDSPTSSSLEGAGFVLVEHRNESRRLFRRSAVGVGVLPGGRGADQKNIGGFPRRHLRSYAALGRRNRARSEADPRAGALGA